MISDFPSAPGMNAVARICLCGAFLFTLMACGQPQALPAVTQEPARATTAALAPAERIVPVEVSDLRHYMHPGGLFSLDVPEQWVASERMSDGELVSQFTDPGENAVIISNVLTMTEQLAPEALAATLQRELGIAYGNQPGFVQQPARQEADGGQLIIWQYQSVVPGLASRLMHGQSTIRQYGYHVGLITIVVPADQVVRLQPVIAAVLTSYTVDSQRSIAASAGNNLLVAVSMQPIQVYTHTGDLFRIAVPTTWAISDQSRADRALVTWSDPSENGWLIVHIVRDDSQRSKKELSRLFTGVISATFGTQPHFSIDSPTPQPDGRLSIRWSYRAQADNQITLRMYGTSFVVQRGPLIAIVGASLPASQIDQLAFSLQAVFDSFQLNQAAAGP